MLPDEYNLQSAVSLLTVTFSSHLLLTIEAQVKQ